MRKVILLILTAVLLLSCNRKNFTLNTNESTSYEVASKEIENSRYVYRSQIDAQPVSVIPDVRIETQKSTVKKKQTKKILLSHRPYNDTIPNDNENYQKENLIENSNAKLAFVFGLLGLIPVGPLPLFGIVAMIFGILALVEMKKEPYKYKGKGKAIFGVVVGALIILVIALAVAYVILI